jgi:hypothetical protein
LVRGMNQQHLIVSWYTYQKMQEAL